jgi:hypothetical protein
MEHVVHKRLETLRWILRGLLTAFGIVALITVLSVLGFLAIGATILFNPFILVVLGIAIVVIAAMMKNKKDVR